MNAKELATVLDQLGCAEINIGVGKGIHDMIKEESGESKNCIAPEYYGRKYYRVQELLDDEIILQVKMIPHCVISYQKLLDLIGMFGKIMDGCKIVIGIDNGFGGQRDNLDMIMSMSQDFKRDKLTVIRE